MVNQMGSPVSMNSQSSKEKKHTPLHLLEKIKIMARQHYIFVCVGVCQHLNTSKDNNQVDTSGREEARIWRRGDVCWCQLNFLKKIHISITRLKCNVKTKKKLDGGKETQVQSGRSQEKEASCSRRGFLEEAAFELGYK